MFVLLKLSVVSIQIINKPISLIANVYKEKTLECLILLIHNLTKTFLTTQYDFHLHLKPDKVTSPRLKNVLSTTAA